MARNLFIQRRGGRFTDYLKAVVVAVAAALLIRHFFLEVYRIPSESMQPTLLAGDFVVVNKTAYFTTLPWPWGWPSGWREQRLSGLRMPERGDIVVFSAPDDRRKRYIKRVIGLPGDVVAWQADSWWVNGQPLSPAAPTTAPPDSGKVFNVPGQALFMVGDSPANSEDSRHFGFVPVGHLKGRAFLVWLSWHGGRPRFDRFFKEIE